MVTIRVARKVLLLDQPTLNPLHLPILLLLAIAAVEALVAVVEAPVVVEEVVEGFNNHSLSLSRSNSINPTTLNR